MYNLSITKTTAPKAKEKDTSKLGFGKLFTDHMLVIDYTKGQGWHDHRIVPYGDFAMSPAAMVLHYGQAIFEGLKAYHTVDGKAVTFRPKDNLNRMNNSAHRMGMPQLDVEDTYECLMELLKMEKDWIPEGNETSLYIRPTMIATDPFLGVRASDTYTFFVILSPVGNYYAAGVNPVKIFVEDEYVRSVKGGTGFTKCAGNYGASILAGDIAKEKGYAQVLWLDGIHRKYVEEVGSMNIFFKINGELITPALQGSILPGITRNSILALAKEMGIPACERPISIEEVYEAYTKGQLEEVFGSGTAAVVSPVGVLNWDGKEMVINDMKNGPCTMQLYDRLVGIQHGKYEDTHQWVVEI